MRLVIAVKAPEMKIEEYRPEQRPTINARAKSLIEPVVNRNNETAASIVVIVVIKERLNVSESD